jgi:hypothetical protein
MIDDQVCFCTLAIGKRYRLSAQDLAQDIATFTHYPLVVLTDRPEDFAHYPHVLAFKHQQQSITCCHDKLYALEKALFLSDTCIYVDASTRISAAVKADDWQPGITTRQPSPNGASITLKKNHRLTQKLAHKLNLDLSQVQPLSESVFVVKIDAGRELAFLSLWDRIGKYFELNGIYGGKSRAIELAAAQAGLAVRYDPLTAFVKTPPHLKRQPRWQQLLVKQQTHGVNRRQLIKLQQVIRYQVIQRLQQGLIRAYCELRLRVVTLNDAGFYYNELMQSLVNWCVRGFGLVYSSLK